MSARTAKEPTVTQDWKTTVELPAGRYADCGLSVIGEIERTYGWMPVAGASVMDIGACFGAYSAFAASRGAKAVRSYEPHPDNYANLERMAAVWPVVDPRNYAIARERGPVQLWVVPGGKNPGNHSTEKHRGRTPDFELESLSFAEEIAAFQPQVLKVDCEGAEYDFLPSVELPSSVRFITIELHLNRKSWRLVAAPRLLSSLRAQGFEEARGQVELGGSRWHAIARLQR